jgi:hypothetical protein
MCAVAAVAALGAQASGAPISSLGLKGGAEIPPREFSPVLFDTSRLEWETGAEPIDAREALELLDAEQDPGADAILIPTPGTAALAALAGLVVILPRKRA